MIIIINRIPILVLVRVQQNHRYSKGNQPTWPLHVGKRPFSWWLIVKKAAATGGPSAFVSAKALVLKFSREAGRMILGGASLGLNTVKTMLPLPMGLGGP